MSSPISWITPGRHDRRDSLQGPSAQRLALRSQPATLGIGEAEPLPA